VINIAGYRHALLAASHIYVTQGFAVIPLSKVDYDVAGKKAVYPLIKWVADGPLTSHAEADRWFGSGDPRVMGIALATGPSGLMVIDEDTYKSSFRAAVDVPEGWVQTSARGGRHVFTRLTAGQRNTAGANGIDTRAAGGLVIAAPTAAFHPDGSVTHWLSTRPLHELDAAALPAAPADFLATLPRKTAPELVRQPGEVAAPTVLTPGVAAAIVAEKRRTFLATPRGAGLHTAMQPYIGVLGRYLTALGCPEAELEGAVVEQLNEHVDGPVDSWESLPGFLAWVWELIAAEPWRLEEDPYAALKASGSHASAGATAADLAELLSECVRKGRPEARARLVGRVDNRLAWAPPTARWGAFEREAAAAFAGALAGDFSGEFALAVLHEAFTEHVRGTDPQFELTILTALGSVLEHYAPRQGDAA
jgi:hypothetical protein